MGKYTGDARELLKLVGGTENIAAVSHCMTRMRFVLGDPAKADVKGIEAMKVVKGSFTQAGQFQVIIGNDVAAFYNDFTAVTGIEGVSKDAVKKAATANQNVMQRAVVVIAEIFAPIIPAIIVGGLILGFRNVIDAIYLFENGTKTLVEISTFWAGMDKFLWLIGEAVRMGQPLLKFDREKIKAAGHPDVTICVVTNGADHPAFHFESGRQAVAGRTVIAERPQIA